MDVLCCGVVSSTGLVYTTTRRRVLIIIAPTGGGCWESTGEGARERHTESFRMSNLVDSWLNGIGLGYAVPIFAGQGINSPDMLSELDVVDFPELGISDQNDRKKVCALRETDRARVADVW